MSRADTMPRQWVLPAPLPDSSTVLTGVPLLNQILRRRGIHSAEEAVTFLAPREQPLSDPHLLPDLERAADIIRAAVARQARFVVFGDYDADGIASTAMLVRVLKKLGVTAEPMIPHRMRDGYGLTPGAAKRIAAQRGDCVITVDCGSSSPDEIAGMLAAGADVIVLDHHTLTTRLPDGVALVSPQRPDSHFPGTDLCAATVAWMLVRELLGDRQAEMYLPYATLATITDVVSLLGENRALVARGLLLMRRWALPGFRALCEVAKIEQRELTAHHLGFVIGPRLNAAGRVASPELALNLLLADDAATALPLAHELNQLNIQRRADVDAAVDQAHDLLHAGVDPRTRSILVVDSPAWSIGWAGIVASRLVEAYGRPALVLDSSSDTTRGSARTARDISVVDAIACCSEYLQRWGGHAGAAGLSLARNDLPTFASCLERTLDLVEGIHEWQPVLECDAIAMHSDLTLDTARQLERLQPFGHGNPEPLLYVAGLRSRTLRASSDGRTLLLNAMTDDGREIGAVGFRMGERVAELAREPRVDVIATLSANSWKGRERAQLILSDIRPSNCGV